MVDVQECCDRLGGVIIGLDEQSRLQFYTFLLFCTPILHKSFSERLRRFYWILSGHCKAFPAFYAVGAKAENRFCLTHYWKSIFLPTNVSKLLKRMVIVVWASRSRWKSYLSSVSSTIILTRTRCVNSSFNFSSHTIFEGNLKKRARIQVFLETIKNV